jgi:hypothetical protein
VEAELKAAGPHLTKALNLLEAAGISNSTDGSFEDDDLHRARRLYSNVQPAELYTRDYYGS